ncbi:MAG: hypothetical protein GX620_13740 [Chloroflexi bacterium]|nr:hypothetical protein [Chloroflexota bacterium]
MILRDIVALIPNTSLQDADLDIEIPCACAADLMSDVLAFAEPGSLLLTSLCNPQVVRTAQVADISAVIFVHGKMPSDPMLTLARELSIPLFSTPYPMFEVCGRLHAAGVRAGIVVPTEQRRV